MSRLTNATPRIQFSGQQPTSITPLRYPRFTVSHFDQPCCSGYKKRTFSSAVLHGKRKGSSESTFHPRTKQQITEARIATSMAQLSLESTYQQGASSAGDKTCDEGFFEDLTELNLEENDIDLTDEADRLPQFSLDPDIKECLDKMQENLLPNQLLQTMNEHCLAVVPYIAPSDRLLVFSSDPPVRREERSSGKSRAGRSSPYSMISKSDSEEEMVY